MSSRAAVTLHIDCLVVETDRPVSGIAFRRALEAALATIILQRGVPDAWNRDLRADSAEIDGFASDRGGDEAGLARALATRLYEGVVR
jgi:hypothetical protein